MVSRTLHQCVCTDSIKNESLLKAALHISEYILILLIYMNQDSLHIQNNVYERNSIQINA